MAKPCCGYTKWRRHRGISHDAFMELVCQCGHENGNHYGGKHEGRGEGCALCNCEQFDYERLLWEKARA